MDTTLDDVELAVQDSYARFFAKESTTQVVRAAEPLGFDRGLWNQVLAMGGLQIAVPTDVGGDAAGTVCLALVAQELGKNIAPVPLIDSTSAARTLARVGSAEALSALEAMLAGDEVVVLSPRPLVNGTAQLVPSGAVADRIVAMEDGALVLAEVKHGPASEPPRNLGSMPLADCSVTDERIRLAEGAAASEAFERAVVETKALTAAALVGIADKSIEVALEYVKIRRAFGTLIGSFQTVSHRLADSVVDLDGARLLAYEAAWALDHDAGRAPAVAAMSFLFASETARQCSLHCLRFHGGLGFTMEHDSQLYYRRAKSWPLALTSVEDEYQHLADVLYGPSEGGK